MNQMMRRLAVRVTLLFLVAAIAACVDKKPEEQPSKEPPASQQPPAAIPDTGAVKPEPAPGAQPKPQTTPQRPAREPSPSPTAEPPTVVPEARKPELASKPEAKPEQPKPVPIETPQPAPTAPPSPSAPQRPAAQSKTAITKDVVVLTGSPMGGVRFEHKLHAERAGGTCASCHHPSKPEKPAGAPQQACSDCHTKAAKPPMKTKLQAAFHNPTAQSGTCIDCHKTENANGKKAPMKCVDCHKKGAR